MAMISTLALSASASAQPPVCDDWQEELQVTFPERIAQGTTREVVVSWKPESDGTTAVSQLVARVDERAIVALPVPSPGTEARLPVVPVSGGRLDIAVSWQQDAGGVLACAGTETGVVQVSPSRSMLARYARRMRPVFAEWGQAARPAIAHMDRGRSLLRSVDDNDVAGITRVAPQAGVAIGRAAPILRTAAVVFRDGARRVTPPLGMATQQRRLTREFTRIARTVEVLGNVLGRIDSPLALLSASFTINKLSIGTPGKAWADEMVGNYKAADLRPARWIANLAKD